MRTLVLGGIRSGKSRWAEQTIGGPHGSGHPVRYLATGPSPGADADWSARVSRHRARRPAHWATVETADVAACLRETPAAPTLVDDIGGWLTATMDRHGAWEPAPAGGPARDPVEDVEDEITELVDAVAGFGAALTLVSPEVGLTVVPATASGRRFADTLGELNQRLAAACERVVLVIAGVAVPVKPERVS